MALLFCCVSHSCHKVLPFIWHVISNRTCK